MSLKILMGAAALSALASTAAWAGDPPSQQTEVRREVVISGDPHGAGQCHVMIMHAGPEEALKAMADHHGAITREEFLAMHAKLFDELDLNHDGVLEPDEIAKAHSAMMENHDVDCAKVMEDHGMPDMHGDMHGDMHDGHGEGDARMEIRIAYGAKDFDKLDTKHDGHITFEEFAAPLREAFDQLDPNHHGYIERSEWEGHGRMIIRKETHDDGKDDQK